MYFKIIIIIFIIRYSIQVINLLLFFSKIPDLWGQKLINTYISSDTDTLGKSIVRDELSEWCGDVILAKMTRGLKKIIFFNFVINQKCL